MARTNIFEVVIDETGAPVTGADVYVYDARTTDEITVYSTELGGGTLTQPIATVAGAIPGWVPEGEYDLAYSYGLTSGTRRYNAIKGGNPLLAAEQVTDVELADDSVGSAELQGGTVSDSELQDDSVGTAELKDLAVETTNIQELAVTNGKIADGAVTTAKIGAAQVTNSKVADGAIDAVKIAADAVGNDELADDAVDTANVLANAITYLKIDGQSITTGASAAIPNITVATPTQTATADAPTAGTYIVFVTAHCTNDYNAANISGTITSDIKVEGSTVHSLTENYQFRTTETTALNKNFIHAFPAVLAANDTVTHWFTDAGTSLTDVPLLGVVIWLLRIGNA